MAEPNYQVVLNRLSHMIALNKEGKVQQAIDNLVLTIFAIGVNPPPLSAIDICRAVQDFFSLSLNQSAIEASLDRLIGEGKILQDPDSKLLSLAPKVSADYAHRFHVANDLERHVREAWLVEFRNEGHNLPLVQENEAWNCLRAYMAKAFLSHGARTVLLLDPKTQINDEYKKGLSTYLGEAIAETCKELDKENAAAAVQWFFTHDNEDRTTYIAQMLDGTFTFFALTVDDATTAFLRKTFSPVSLFADTNFIFGLLNLHDNPGDEASREVVDLIRTLKFPFRLYYHEKTLEELTHTIDSIHDDLRMYPPSPNLSRAILRTVGVPVSGIEMRYHELNAVSVITPDIFFDRYSHLPTLLKEKGFDIFRVGAQSEEMKQQRYRLEAEFDAYLKDRNRPRPYNAITHDMTVWQSLQGLRRDTSSALDAGAFFLSNDNYLYQFDWLVLRKQDALGTVIVPSQFLQLLRPFVPATDDFNRRFVETLSYPEFRLTTIDYTSTTRVVIQYLAAFADISEESAVRILANKILIQQLQKLDPASKEFGRLIESQIMQDNDQLLQANQALQEEKTRALRRAQESEELAKQHEAQRLAQEKLVAENEGQLRAEQEQSRQREQALLIAKQQEAEKQKEIERLKAESKAKDTATQAAQESARQAAFRTRVVLAILVLVSGLGLIFVMTVFANWPWLNSHPNRLGLIVGAVIAVVGVSWAVVDEKRRWIGAVALVIAMLAAIVPILGK